MHGKKHQKRNDFRRQFLDPIEQKLNRRRKHEQRERTYREIRDEEDYENVYNIRCN
jgi:hypothetical protein